MKEYFRREWEAAQADPWGALLMFLIGVGLGVLAAVVLAT